MEAQLPASSKEPSDRNIIYSQPRRHVVVAVHGGLQRPSMTT